MTILAIDTCEANCSAALVVPDGQTFVCSEDIGRGHAERLLPMIEGLLAKASLEYCNLTRLAVITGPGTFTGLRIGLSVARGLALSLKIPCVGLSSLSALAGQAKAGEGPVHAVVRGRGGQVYYQGFKGEDVLGLPRPISEALNIDADQVHQLIENQSGYVLGSGVPLVMGREIGLADAIDPVALARLSAGLTANDFKPDPLYLRAADAVKAKPVFKISVD